MRLFWLIVLTAITGCTASSIPDASSEQNVTSAHRLEGFHETILTGDSSGKLTLAHVGDALSLKVVTSTHAETPVSVHAQDGRFEAIFNDSMDVINAESGEVERSFKLPVQSAGDVEHSGAEAWVTDRAKGKMVQFDPTTGAEFGAVDLASVAAEGTTIEPRNMLRLGSKTFVQVARRKNGRAAGGAVAVIENKAIKKVIELTNGTKPGLMPDFPMTFDQKRNAVFVSCAGNRPSDTGMLIQIDPDTLTIRSVFDAQSGFQGMTVMGPSTDDLFIIYHTSTPTTSSHLFGSTLNAKGDIDLESGTLVDAFDGIDALSINPSGSLVAMANTCITGFCIGGAGVSFIDVKTRKVLPKLLKAELGFEPSFVEFAR